MEIQLVSPKRIKSHFLIWEIEENNIYQSLRFCFKQHYPSKQAPFKQHSERLLNISLFLFITSSFLYRKKPNINLYSFHWKNYIRIFSRNDLLDFINCSILYMIEYNLFSKEEKKLIKKYLPKNIPSFQQAYYISLSKRNSKENRFSLVAFPFEKYLDLITLSIKLFELMKYELSKKHSKVIELIELSDIWKEKMVKIFNYKAEYIAFLYFVNLRRRKNWFFQDIWNRFLCLMSMAFNW